MAVANFGAFKQAAFFDTLREAEKEKSEREDRSLRTGIAERGVAAQERSLDIQQGVRQAELDKDVLEQQRVRFEDIISNAGRSLAGVALESGRNTGDTEFGRQFTNQLSQLAGRAEQAGIFTSDQIELRLQQAIDAEMKRSLGAASVGVRNVQDREGNIISEVAAQQQIASNQATPADFTIAPTQQETGEAGAFGGEAEIRDLNQQATQANSFLRNTNRAIEALEQTDAAGQLVGNVAQFADNVGANLSSLAQVGFGGLTADIAEQDTSAFEALIGDIPQATAQFKSALIDMAYAKALIQNGSRPTQQDFDNAYRTLTGGSQDKDIIISNLRNAASGIVDDFRFRYRTSTGQDFQGRFDTEQPQLGGGQPIEGSRRRQDGNVFVFRNGQWVQE